MSEEKPTEEEPDYRPRRAWSEQPESVEDVSPSAAAQTGSDTDADKLGPTAAAESVDPDGTGSAGHAGPPAVTPDPDDAPPPLYRDESTQIRSVGSSASGSSSVDRGSVDETTILSRARQRKLGASKDPDATTLLPRTATGGRLPRSDDFDDDDLETDPRHERRRLIVMIGAVTVVVILGLVVGYAIIKTTSQPVVAPVPLPAGQSPSAGGQSPNATEDPGTALITDDLMLSPDDAGRIDKKRTWKVALTQRGSSPDSPHPACLAADAVDGAPSPQQTVLRLLSSSGSNSPAALQQATAYNTPEEAAQAYAFASRTIGDCAMSGGWIYQGHQVDGVGDQAVGVTIQVVDGDTQEFRTVVLARTGRIVDVVDVANPDKAASVQRVATVAGAVVDTQCQAAGGACSDQPETADGPPPLGGDQPGFLASGDLPPIGPELTRWAGTTPGEPDPDLLRGSGCETTDWSKVEAKDRSHRTYLLSDSSSKFGLDEVVITTGSDKAATKLAEKVRADWKSCGKRQLTATVAPVTGVKGVGAKSTDIAGWTTEVTQKSDKKTNTYRVGVVTSGAKVVYLFLNPQDDVDLTADQFDIVAVRAGQRASQVN
ncbi:MAG: hypothetical protein L0H26_06750 [Microlunatus sp.]|nr:hypothetical protein [Microlunatus sp.]